MKYKWLHISDLHSICSGIRTIIMRDSLLDEIEYLNKQNQFSFLLITGDISDKNQGYNDAKIFIHKIIEVIGLSTNRVFIVPGNHDLDRKIPNDREKIIKECWDVDILDDKEDTLIKTLMTGQDDFFKAYEEILGRQYPTDKIHFHQNLDENVSIIHLNTSWMCFDSENESGKLHIGLKTAYKCLKNEQLTSTPIKIAIGHHKISDFNTTVESHIKRIFKTMDIDLYLGGHCHYSSVVYDPTINTEFCSCRQARAEDKNYQAGFIVGEINTQTDQSNFQFYSWDNTLATWTYDYTVNPAKHGKYYLRGEKFTKEPEVNRNIIVDLKLFDIPLDYELIMDRFSIQNSAIYKSSLRNIRPKSIEQWNSCLKDIRNIYDTIVKDSNKCIHIFPIALIPILVSFGYLIQNNNPNIKIYQYFENEEKWVFDEHNDDIPINNNLVVNGSKKLALALSISGEVNKNDIDDVLSNDYDLLSIGINNPRPSILNYRADVLRAKTITKTALDKLNNNYDEIHLFLAAPAGLCIEIGRIIREHMYPDTYIYNYGRTSDIKYSKIFNLKQIRDI